MKVTCPHCRRVNDSHISRDAEVPGDGDVSICWRCRKLAVFVETPTGYAVRMPTPDEQAEFDQDPDIRAALAAAAESYTPSQAATLLGGGQ